MFKVKCAVVGQYIGQAVGTLVLHRNVPEAAERAITRAAAKKDLNNDER
jgi:hypothetical protein